MFIHQHTCIAPIKTEGEVNLNNLPVAVNGILTAIEPELTGVPPGMLRRMSKAVKMGLAAGLPILKNNTTDGIIIGTANGGMQECVHFLNQIVAYNEGLLTPANFVQSTPNAIAGQLSMLTKNNHYNATHVHNGLAFESALIDAQLWLKENINAQYLVGGVDEVSSYNYNIDKLAGWYSSDIQNDKLYTEKHTSTIAGEGAAMFLVNNSIEGALAKITQLKTIHTEDEDKVKTSFAEFLKPLNLQKTDTLLISGYNGDIRQQHFYTACASVLPECKTIRFKHLTGDYPTATSFAVWLACKILNNFKENNFQNIKNVVIYNAYHNAQHSIIHLTR